jgi:hypothetical protein
MRILFLILGILSFTACTELNNVIGNDDITGDDSSSSFDPSTLPTSIADYINTNYPNYTIEDMDNDIDCDGTSIIEVELENGNDEIELVFDTENNLLYIATEIRTSNLPTAVTDSIAANFPNYFLDDEADELTMADGSTRYEVELEGSQNDLEVLFAADGTLICQEVDMDDDDNDGDDSNDDNNVDSLPTSITDYITLNYPNYSIDEAEYDMTCDSTMVIEVEIESGNSELELTFDMSGNFLYASVEINSMSLPAAVSNSITTNFSGYTLEDDEAEELTMADGSKRYEVELESTQNDLEVLFAADGTVICQEVDND